MLNELDIDQLIEAVIRVQQICPELLSEPAGHRIIGALRPGKLPEGAALNNLIVSIAIDRRLPISEYDGQINHPFGSNDEFESYFYTSIVAVGGGRGGLVELKIADRACPFLLDEELSGELIAFLRAKHAEIRPHP